MFTKAPLVTVLCALLTSGASAQVTVVADFEVQTAGNLVPTGGADPEGWLSIAGQQVYMPDGAAQINPCQLPINGSNQYCEISPAGLGPAVPVVPPSTPGTWPYTGGVSQMRLATAIPTPTSGQLDFALDWYWATAEGPMGGGIGSDDFAEVLLIDPSTNTVIVSALYVDTYPPYVVSGGNACFSGITGVFPVNNVGNAQTATVTVPPAFHGLPVEIHVIAANQFDDMFDSVLWIDNLRFVDPASNFSLTATTSGGGVGDLSLNLSGNPSAGATDVQVLVSGTTAPAGLGSGIFLGLVPDGLLITFLFLPSQPFYPFHYPVGLSPFAAPFVLPAGTAAGLAGQTWELVAYSYSPALGILDVSNYQQLAW